MSYPFTLYMRPTAKTSEHEMEHIRPEDEQFLRENDVKISMEEIMPGQICVYADDGRLLDDEETPDEITYIVPTGETCEDTMAKICEKVRKRKQKIS